MEKAGPSLRDIMTSHAEEMLCRIWEAARLIWPCEVSMK